MIASIGVASQFVILCVNRMQVAEAFVTLPAVSRVNVKTSTLVFSNDQNDTNDTTEWTMSQDWALLDSVPEFTVGEDVHARTFWAQLAASTPMLSPFTEADLQQRYAAMLWNDYDPISVDHPAPSATFSSPAPPLPLLRSPQVLQDWKVLSEEGPSFRMSGVMSDGRAIWFPIQTVGKFESDPKSLDMEVKTRVGATAGGFVEAVGGRVYELGQPAAMKLNHEEQISERVTSVVLPKQEKDGKSAMTLEALRRFPWVSATTATMSALFASSILSAAIGYGSGLGIASIEARESSLRSASSLPPSAVVLRQHSRTSGSVVIMQSRMAGTQSVSEQRERAEERVHQEQRLLERMLERLEKDQIVLQLLRMEEDAAGSLAP